jgi:peptidoglycan/LPS O-acetylase OafA/YrhL
MGQKGQSMTPDSRFWVDALRGLAAVQVLLYHLHPGWFPGGYLGVDQFFVISGYLITGSLVRDGGPTLSGVLPFYHRRIVRILPGLICLLAGALVLGWFRLLSFDLMDLAREARATLEYRFNFMLADQGSYFYAPARGFPLTHLWSICLEMQVYLVWPILLLLIGRSSSKVNLASMVLMVAGSLFIDIYFYGSKQDKAFFLPWTRLWEFGVGGVLFWWGKQWAYRMAGPALVAAAIGLALWAPDRGGLLPQAMAVALTAAFILIRGEGPLSDLLGVGAWIGRYSYEVYLWHYPVLYFIQGQAWGRTVAVGSAAIALSIVPGKLWGRPGERGMRAALRSPAYLWILALSVLFLRISAKRLENSRGAPSRPITRGVPLERFALDACRVHDCFLIPGQDEKGFDEACVPRSNGLPRVLLFGDSHAAMLYPALAASGAAHGFQVLQLDMAGCPPTVFNGGDDWQTCSENNERVLGLLRRDGADVAILAANWALYDDCLRWEADKDVVARNDLGRNRWPVTALGQAIERVRAAGARQVLVLGQFPFYEEALSLRGAPAEGSSPRLKAGLVRACYRLDQAVRAEALRHGAQFLSPMAVLCDASGCLVSAPVGPPSPWVLDHTHLTRAGADHFVGSALEPSLFPLLGGSKGYQVTKN